MPCPQIRLCSSTLVEDLGRKLHVSHLLSQHLKMYHVQKAAGRGLSETARLVDVKVYLIPLILYQTTHSFLFLALKEVADVQEIQEYLWKNPIFHNYSLQVEFQPMPPLLQDFGNPVSNMFRRDLRWLYALL